MARSRPDMSPAEFNVMKALWRVGHGTVADIRARYQELFAPDAAYTTVLTLLGRLEGKGMVKVDKSRQPYVYRPTKPESSVIKMKLSQFIDAVFDGNPRALVLRLLEDEDLTEEDLRRIEEKLHRHGKEE